jgi:hypothetical protein
VLAYAYRHGSSMATRCLRCYWEAHNEDKDKVSNWQPIGTGFRKMDVSDVLVKVLSFGPPRFNLWSYLPEDERASRSLNMCAQ